MGSSEKPKLQRMGTYSGGSKRIEPFAFDTVFRHASVETPKKEVAKPDPALLHMHIEELEAQIAALTANHANEIERVRAEAFEAGLAQARGEQAEAVLAAVDALHAGLEDVDARFDHVVGGLIREAGDMAFQAAELLAGHVIATEPVTAIDEALSRALEQVACATRLTVHVHPDLKPILEERVQERTVRQGRSVDIVFVEDASLPMNDARIGWAEGGLHVDSAARREAVLAELADVLGREPRL